MYVFIIMMEGSLLCLVFYYIVNRIIIIVVLGFAEVHMTVKHKTPFKLHKGEV